MRLKGTESIEQAWSKAGVEGEKKKKNKKGEE